MHALKRLLVLLLVLAPGIASACPNCVGQDRNTTILKVVGAFMLVPFGIFYFILRIVRGAARSDSDGQADDRA